MIATVLDRIREMLQKLTPDRVLRRGERELKLLLAIEETEDILARQRALRLAADGAGRGNHGQRRTP